MKLITRSRRINRYKITLKKTLLSPLDESKSVESEKNLDNIRINQIREECNKLRDRFLKLKMKEIRTNLYKIENKKNLSTQKVITFKISVNRGGSYIDSPK